MIISYFGKQYFKVAQGDQTIALNPISKESNSGIKPVKFGADVVLSSVHHPDYNGIDTVSFGEKNAFAITGPGEYEVQEIFIKGVQNTAKLEDREYINTSYSFEFDGINLCFLGAITKPLDAASRDGLDAPDILFIPVGTQFLDPAAAYKLAVSLEPSIIIPMDYDQKSLALFLKEAGAPDTVALDKLVLKRKDLANKQAEVVVLSQ